jgi:hypothetical protein
VYRAARRLFTGRDVLILRFTGSNGVVLALTVGCMLAISASVAAPTTPSAFDTRGAQGGSGPADSGSSYISVRAAASSTSWQRAALRRLQLAAAKLHRRVNSVLEKPNDADFLRVIQAQFDRAELILAIRNARAVGLETIARRFQRVLELETKRLNESIAFSDLLREGAAHGERAAQKAHEDNPNLTPAVLGNIAVNAANWHGNKALLNTTLRAAKQKGPQVYEIALKKGEDLDRRAYSLFRALSVGSRKTNIRYGGREGLHRLPDANGGFNGGLIGLRRAAETSGKKSPAIDVNVNGKLIKIHVRHEP